MIYDHWNISTCKFEINIHLQYLHYEYIYNVIYTYNDAFFWSGILCITCLTLVLLHWMLLSIKFYMTKNNVYLIQQMLSWRQWICENGTIEFYIQTKKQFLYKIEQYIYWEDTEYALHMLLSIIFILKYFKSRTNQT